MKYRFDVDDNQASLLADEGDLQAARIDFRKEDQLIFLDYLWVDPARRGQGLARKMVDAFVEYARAEGARIKPICGVSASILRSDPRYEDVLLT